MQADRVELRQHVDPVQAAVDAVRERDVDQPILARQGDGRLGAILGQRIQPRAATAAENESDDTFHVVLALDDKIDETPRNDHHFHHLLAGQEFDDLFVSPGRRFERLCVGFGGNWTLDRSLPFICTGISIVPLRASAASYVGHGS